MKQYLKNILVYLTAITFMFSVLGFELVYQNCGSCCGDSISIELFSDVNKENLQNQNENVCKEDCYTKNQDDENSCTEESKYFSIQSPFINKSTSKISYNNAIVQFCYLFSKTFDTNIFARKVDFNEKLTLVKVPILLLTSRIIL